MEINLSKTVKQAITMLILLILPVFAILLGVIFNVLNAWYFVLCVTWFASGLIFYSVIN